VISFSESDIFEFFPLPSTLYFLGYPPLLLLSTTFVNY